jgi:hypothetical protein
MRSVTIGIAISSVGIAVLTLIILIMKRFDIEDVKNYYFEITGSSSDNSDDDEAQQNSV